MGNKAPQIESKPLIQDAMLKGLLVKSVTHVFESNVGRKAEIDAHLTPRGLNEALNGLNEEIYSCFILLDRAYPATVCMQIPHALAKIVAMEYLNYEAFELDFGDGKSNIEDAVRETTNMISGTLRNILAQAGLECSMSPPKLHSSPKVPLINMSKAIQCVALRFKLPDAFAFGCLYRMAK
ncbi:MAG: chemotaxis protein CheX [Opitutales bacterium]